jgi:hypothetical protein
MLYRENIEGMTEWNIPEVRERVPGMSAMLRLKNEAEFIRPCVLSILDLFDEVVCCLQNSTDGTEAILQQINSPKIKIYNYPFDSLPNGPGHGKQPRGSVYERAYFYNWCLAKTTRAWVSKWDGDMVALPWINNITALTAGSDAIKIPGTNIVGMNPWFMSKYQPETPIDIRFFRVGEGVHYESGMRSERLVLPDNYYVLGIPHSGYLHFKFCKSEDSQRAAWPENWRDVDHFQRICDRAEPGAPYVWEIPPEMEASCQR